MVHSLIGSFLERWISAAEAAAGTSCEVQGVRCTGLGVGGGRVRIAGRRAHDEPFTNRLGRT